MTSPIGRLFCWACPRCAIHRLDAAAPNGPPLSFSGRTTRLWNARNLCPNYCCRSLRRRVVVNSAHVPRQVRFLRVSAVWGKMSLQAPILSWEEHLYISYIKLYTQTQQVKRCRPSATRCTPTRTGWLRSTVGRTPVFGRRTDPVLRSACSRRVTTMWVNRPLKVSRLG